MEMPIELTHCGTYDELFRFFHEHLQGLGLIVNEGKIIDAGYVGTEDRFTRKGMTIAKSQKFVDVWNRCLVLQKPDNRVKYK